MYNKKLAFTLAEVLITIGIIGVVAAITLPSVIQNQKERQTLSKLKKVYSTFLNAYALTIDEYGTPDTWDDLGTDKDGVNAFWEKLKPNLKLLKECDFDNRFSCWNVNDYFYYLNGSNSYVHVHNGNTKTFILNDGTMLAFSVVGTTDSPNPGCVKNDNYFACAQLIVKTDSSQKQIYGKNIFEFRFEHSQFVPSKKNADMSSCHNLGTKCTAWAVFNNNLDYLKCDDLSWNGKNKCN